MTASNSTQGKVVAIDGPSGAGKSTVARRLAERLGFVYLDTGAMYRTVALAVHQAGISPDDEAAIARICSGLHITFEQSGTDCRVFANGVDVSTAIRTPEISLLTSKISAIKAVRDVLLSEQRRMSRSVDVVVEGRDIGTVVFPNADVKFFLSASSEERGKRRFLELRARGESVTLEQTIADVIERDIQDEQREHSPLCKADDAVVIDSDGLPVEDVLVLMERKVRDQLAKSTVSCGDRLINGVTPEVLR